MSIFHNRFFALFSVTRYDSMTKVDLRTFGLSPIETENSAENRENVGKILCLMSIQVRLQRNVGMSKYGEIHWKNGQKQQTLLKRYSPREKGSKFTFGGGEGNRTPVRVTVHMSRYMLSLSLSLDLQVPTDRPLQVPVSKSHRNADTLIPASALAWSLARRARPHKRLAAFN